MRRIDRAAVLAGVERALALLVMAATLLLVGAIDCGDIPPADSYTPAAGVSPW